MDGLVSIIMPAYNSSEWIEETINSVKSQTYTNWELIVCDDCSQDNTVELVRELQKTDKRIVLTVNEKNCGAGLSRNNSLRLAKGRFIAYLDSDDLWVNDKLEKQLKFMGQNKYLICYTSYDLINETGEYRKTIHIPDKTTYDSFLKRPLTCSHTILIDSSVVSKDLLIMPDLRRGQDAATWLKILKSGVTAYGLDISLAKYRRHSGSVSSNKLKALKRTWHLYRNVEKLSLMYSIECFISYVFNALKKYS